MKKTKINTVFIDLEGTITDDETLNCFVSDPDLKGHSFGGILRELLVTKYKLTPRDALTILNSVTEPCGHIDPFYFISHSDYDITEEELWREILAWQRDHLIIYDDAVKMIRQLYESNYKLYMVSNCARTAVYSQLNSAGLAEKLSSGYFVDVYGCFDLGATKDDPEVYKTILLQSGINPDEVVMVGNEPAIDLESPHKAGIGHSVIVNRELPEAFKISGKDVFVNSLELVPGLMDTINCL
ncbi:MAG: HAD family hydrolase [Victivallales bacterium]|jgi:FMN phosphatase YigB (HAD superfamily)